MIDRSHTRGALGPGDRAPDFDLPAADSEGTVALAEYRRRGPVLLSLLRGLYCPFCRRTLSLLKPSCEELRGAGIALVGIVIASPERARQYFRHFPPCFPVAAAPDRAIHRAYGLTEFVRTPEFLEHVEHRAMDALRDLGLKAPAGEADSVFQASDGVQLSAEDHAEWQRPVQTIAHFLIGRDGVIRWAQVESLTLPLPKVQELVALV
jgi:peroxiredoxin